MPIVYMHVRYIGGFFLGGGSLKRWVLFLNKHFDISGDIWDISQKLSLFKKIRLIVNFVGKSDRMSFDVRIFRDVLDIFTHNKQTNFILSHFYYRSIYA